MHVTEHTYYQSTNKPQTLVFSALSEISSPLTYKRCMLWKWLLHKKSHFIFSSV